jgi:hypothetical protein
MRLYYRVADQRLRTDSTSVSEIHVLSEMRLTGRVRVVGGRCIRLPRGRQNKPGPSSRRASSRKAARLFSPIAPICAFFLARLLPLYFTL